MSASYMPKVLNSLFKQRIISFQKLVDEVERLKGIGVK